MHRVEELLHQARLKLLQPTDGNLNGLGWMGAFLPGQILQEEEDAGGCDPGPFHLKVGGWSHRPREIE